MIFKANLIQPHVLSKSGNGYEHLWLDDKYLTSPEWETIRAMVKKIAAAFDWEIIRQLPLYSIIIG